MRLGNVRGGQTRTGGGAGGGCVGGDGAGRGLTFHLWVRADVRMAKPLQDAIESRIIVKRIIP